MVPHGVRKVAADIKKLKIQGATEVAVEGIRSLKHVGNKDVKTLKECAALLAKTRPTEPLLRNGLKYVLLQAHKKKSIHLAADAYIYILQKAFQKIVETGATKIRNKSKIMTHCHSSLVTHILIHAKKAHGKKFEVYASETRPKLQGRITAKELAKAGIKVDFYVDSAMRSFVNKVDLVLVGCDAITAEGDFLNKVGTSELALCANEAGTEFAVATELLKFDPKTMKGFPEKIEERSPGEIWKRPPARVKIKNPAFDITPAKYVHYLITEDGVIMPQSVIGAVGQKYPWIFG